MADLKALASLYRLIRRGRFDIVHTHSSKAGVLGRLAAWLAGTPIIVHTLHSLVFHDYQPWIVNRAWWAVKRAFAPITDHYLSVADAISEKAIAEGIAPRERFTTVYSGMELDWFLSFNGEAWRRPSRAGDSRGRPGRRQGGPALPAQGSRPAARGRAGHRRCRSPTSGFC